MRLAELEALLDVAHHGGGGEQIVGGNVEEALDLAGVEVEAENPVGAGPLDQIGHQLGRDRRARAGLAVLAGIAEIGDHRGDPAGRRPPQRIDQDQQLHQVVVGRKRGRLDDEHVLAAYVLLDLDEDLHVGEAPDRAPGERQPRRAPPARWRRRRALAAQVEGGDVDAGIAERDAQRADEARLVVVGDVEHVRPELGFHVDALDLDDARLAVGEHRAGHRALLALGPHRQAHRTHSRRAGSGAPRRPSCRAPSPPPAPTPC
jgi:hypothetical protein